jgi:hypothetical protein
LLRSWYSAQNPEEVFPKIDLSLSSDAARFISGYKGLDLDMHKLRSGMVAAQDIRVRGVAKGNNCVVTPAAKFARDEELTRIPPVGFVRH